MTRHEWNMLGRRFIYVLAFPPSALIDIVIWLASGTPWFLTEVLEAWVKDEL